MPDSGTWQTLTAVKPCDGRASCLTAESRARHVIHVSPCACGLTHGEERGSPCVWCLPCVFLQTHGKSSVCHVPEKMDTAKILAHGELVFSGSVCCRNIDIIMFWTIASLKSNNFMFFCF